MTMEALQGPSVESLLSDEVRLPSASPGLVDLPGGWVDGNGLVYRQAEVRELTGADEEAMARGSNKAGQIDFSRLLNVIYERGLVRVGSQPATDAIRDSMLVGDKDAVLLGIRIATYGADYETRIVCPRCTDEFDVVFELLTDIKERTLEDPERIYRTVELRAGQAEIRLPTVGDQSLAMSDPKRTAPEMNTILLGQCVRSINGVPTLGDTSMRALGLADRRTLLDYLTNTAPGPRMGEVAVECSSCKEESPMALNMAALFL